MELPRFTYHRPASLEEAVQLLSEHGPEIDVVAGGTDLLPNYKNRLNNKANVLSLAGLEGLRQRSPTQLGALCRLVEIERDQALAEALPVLVETANAISSPPLREHGTVGGNLMLDTRCYYFNQSPMWRKSVDFCLKAEGKSCLVVPSSNDHCYATYSGELAAPLIALGAEVEFLSARGSRRMPLTELFCDEGIIRFADRKADELLIAVHIPEEAQSLKAGYDKLRIRKSIDFPSMGVAIAFRLDKNGALERLHVATTALRSMPESLDDALTSFLGSQPSAELASAIGEAARKASTAYRNVPLEPKYRLKMLSVFIRRMLARLEPRFADT